ncbi:DUF1007 family protein [Pseudorhodobacter aquimaris]|uniref:DUF1007 family protein n=1 Tax=Pseudorhodobacter aquimaris TaxID=687412 RepID=UPI0018DC2C79|nr:DUF1007 family protein [Pseudorhodobacter aquimaris]
MRFFISALLLVLSVNATAAHPHVFVDAKGTFIFAEDGRLAGVRIYWLYDAFTTLLLYETLDLDKDGDGKLDAADLETVKRGETDWAPDYEGDTYLWVEGAKQVLSRPANASAQMHDDRIGVGFELTLENPVDMSDKSASLKIYDPIYYYAYSIDKDSPLLDAPDGCAVQINRFTPDEESADLQKQLEALSQEEIPDDPNVGAMFAEEILLRCD